jgi:hypothetical protein
VQLPGSSDTQPVIASPTVALVGGIGSGAVTGSGSGILQPAESAATASLAVGPSRVGCALVPPPPPPSACSCSSSTTSSGSRKQRAAGAANAANGDVSGSAQSVAGSAAGLPRVTSLHTIALHPAACRYAAASANTATGPASSAARASAQDPVGRSRRAIVRLLVAIVIVFVASWLPYNVVSLRVDLTLDPKYTRLLPFALWFGHAHSAVNPIIYWFFNKSFRNCLRNALQSGCRACSRSRRQRDARASQFV